KKNFDSSSGSAVSPYDGNRWYGMKSGYMYVDDDNGPFSGYLTRKTVAVKEGVSRSAARCIPLEEAREMIEETSGAAVRQASDFKPFVFDPSVTVKVVFTNPSHADTLEHLDNVTRIDGCTITFGAEDFVRAFEWFSAMHFLSPAVR
ncbi:hypothetical protein LCGC14_2804240, partial [marine sediment metagenome]